MPAERLVNLDLHSVNHFLRFRLLQTISEFYYPFFGLNRIIYYSRLVLLLLEELVGFVVVRQIRKKEMIKLYSVLLK